MKENSGGSCSYYMAKVEHPYNGRPEYTAECGELTEVLQLNPYEANIFKEVWRLATARLGLEKEGNSPTRGAEKIIWNGEKMLDKARREINGQG
jgi:hypothetical protein